MRRGHPKEKTHTARSGREKERPAQRRKERSQHSERYCPDCGRAVASFESSRNQHRYWSEYCIAWQLYNKGGYTWHQAQVAAAATKARRMEKHGCAAEEDDAADSKPKGSGKRSREEAAKKSDPVKARVEKKEPKKKKKSKDKPAVSPSPDLPRGGGSRKRPPSSGSEDQGHSGGRKRDDLRNLLAAMIKCL